MRNKILIFISTCVLALSIFVISVGAATVTEIASVDDWNKLADQTSVNGNYKLTANISVSKAIKSFKWTFDGGKNQITFSIQSGDVAPFLDVTGTTTITNLYTYLGKGSSADNYAGGIVAHTASKSDLTLTGCYFSTGSSYNLYGTTAAGGIVGLSEGTVYVKNCDVEIGTYAKISGGRGAGIIGSAKNKVTIIGCNISGGKINGDVTAGGIIGHSDDEYSMLYKNRVKVSSIGLDTVHSGYYGYEGYGLIAGYYKGYASANYVYTTSVVSAGYCGYLVGTCYSYADIFNNAVQTKATNITKDYYKNAPSTSVESNYRKGGLSAPTNSMDYTVYPVDHCSGDKIDNVEYKGTINRFLNFGINIGCSEEICAGSGERYFSTSLIFYNGTKTDGDSYHKSMMILFTDSTKSTRFATIITIQNTPLTLADYGQPTKNHYTFAGWKIDSTGKAASSTYTVTSNYDSYYADFLYATWTADKKTIYFDVDGSSYKNKNLVYDSEFGISSTNTSLDVPNPTKKNYEFKGWEYKNGNKTYTITHDDTFSKENVNALFEINSEIRFNAVFEKVSEDISFRLNGGTLSETFTPVLNKNQSLVLPLAKPLKTGYTFENYTVTNGTKTLTITNGDTISVADVNEFINAGKAVTIDANYMINELKINYYNKTYNGTDINTTIEYNSAYVLPEYNGTRYGMYFDGYSFVYNNQSVRLNPGDELPTEIINSLVANSSKTLDISIVWKEIINYDNNEAFSSLDIPNVTFDSGAEIVNVNKKYNGTTFTSGVKINDGKSFEYEAEGFKDAYILTNEDDAILVINGEEYKAENGVINAKLNNGTNDIKAKGNVTILNISYNEMAISVNFKCQYDTLNHSEATKIRFIAIIDSVVEAEELDKGSFFITINGKELEFKITKIYRILNSIDSEYASKVGRFYAVYTIEGIEEAVAAHTVVEGADLKLSTVEGNNYIASHNSFVLGE